MASLVFLISAKLPLQHFFNRHDLTWSISIASHAIVTNHERVGDAPPLSTLITRASFYFQGWQTFKKILSTFVWTMGLLPWIKRGIVWIRYFSPRSIFFIFISVIFWSQIAFLGIHASLSSFFITFLFFSSPPIIASAFSVLLSSLVLSFARSAFPAFVWQIPELFEFCNYLKNIGQHCLDSKNLIRGTVTSLHCYYLYQPWNLSVWLLAFTIEFLSLFQLV